MVIFVYFLPKLLVNSSIAPIIIGLSYEMLATIEKQEINEQLLDDLMLAKEGYIERTCIFEVKRLEKIPKREIQILSAQQLAQLFKITKKKYPYLLPIIKKVITLKQPLNTVLTGSEQEKNSLKRKIRKNFYKIKQALGLSNYMFDDLRFCQ